MKIYHQHLGHAMSVKIRVICQAVKREWLFTISKVSGSPQGQINTTQTPLLLRIKPMTVCKNGQFGTSSSSFQSRRSSFIIIIINIIIIIIIIIIVIVIIIAFISISIIITSVTNLCWCSFCCTSAGRKPCTWSISHLSPFQQSYTTHPPPTPQSRQDFKKSFQHAKNHWEISKEPKTNKVKQALD